MTASVAGWIAIAAAVAAVIGLTIALVLHLRLRRLRAAQLTLQGSGGGDLVERAVQPVHPPLERDYARIYVKELDSGRAAVSLSPEEQEAVERAMKSQQ